MIPTTFKMQLSKLTKGTAVYDSAEPSAPVRTLYVSKTALDGASAPQSVTVSIVPEAA